MSSEAVGWAFRYSPLTGVAFQIHLAIADSVNDQHGYELWMRQGILATKARTTRQTVNSTLEKMVAEDLLRLLEVGSGGANRYLFLMPEELPAVYDPRIRGVGSDDTPERLGVKRGDKAVGSGDRGVGSDDTEPKRTQGDPNPLLGFDQFWDEYPRRNGKRLERGKAEVQWRKLVLDDRRAAWRAAKNYARAVEAGLTIAKDAHRWLRDQCWADWMDGPGASDRATDSGPQVIRYEEPTAQ